MVALPVAIAIAMAAAAAASAAGGGGSGHPAQGAVRARSAGAGFAASGVSLEGSPLAALEETAVQSELDALSARYYQGASAQWKQEAQARLYGAQAESTRTKGYFEAGSELLGGAASAMSGYSKAKAKA